MRATRNHAGHWLPGVSGNAAGRPVGARDRKPRKPPCRYWDRTANLGVYALIGGPGRLEGGGKLSPLCNLFRVVTRMVERAERGEEGDIRREMIAMNMVEEAIDGMRGKRPQDPFEPCPP